MPAAYCRMREQEWPGRVIIVVSPAVVAAIPVGINFEQRKKDPVS